MVAKRHIKPPSFSQGKNVKVSKEQLAPEQIDYPIFCFKHLQDDYNIDSCDEEQRSALIKQLGKLSQLTWQQIQFAPKNGLGSEKIKKESIKKPLPSFINQDVRHLLAFRFYKKMPFLAHKKGHIMHILFIDPKGKVYDHN